MIAAPPPATVRRLGRATPIFFVGDSTTLIYRNRLYREEASTRTYIGRTVYMPAIHAADMCNSAGVIHPQLISNLALENLLVVDTTGRWTNFRPDVSIATELLAGVVGVDNRPTPIVFSIGGFDALRFIEELGGVFEIDLPDYVPRVGGEPAVGVRHFSFEEACDVARRYVEPYGRAVAQLRSYGLTNLFIHDIPPVDTDDAALGRYHAFYSTARTRYLCLIVMNFLLRKMAEFIDVPFIDLWPYVIRPDGFRDQRFVRDAIHLNSRAALLTLGFVLGKTREIAPNSDSPGAEPDVEAFFGNPGGATDSYDFASIAEPDFADD